MPFSGRIQFYADDNNETFEFMPSYESFKKLGYQKGFIRMGVAVSLKNEKKDELDSFIKKNS